MCTLLAEVTAAWSVIKQSKHREPLRNAVTYNYNNKTAVAH